MEKLVRAFGRCPLFSEEGIPEAGPPPRRVCRGQVGRFAPVQGLGWDHGDASLDVPGLMQWRQQGETVEALLQRRLQESALCRGLGCVLLLPYSLRASLEPWALPGSAALPPPPQPAPKKKKSSVHTLAPADPSRS